MTEELPSWVRKLLFAGCVAFSAVIVWNSGLQGALVLGLIVLMWRGLKRMYDNAPKNAEEAKAREAAKEQERQRRREARRAAQEVQEAQEEASPLRDPRSRRQLRHDAKRLRQMSVEELSLLAAQLNDDNEDPKGPPMGV